MMGEPLRSHHNVAETEASRIDVWLWCVRVCRSRSQAAALCRGGKVEINGIKAKASSKVRPGDEIVVRGASRRWLKVAVCPKRRGPAVEAQKAYEDVTPASWRQAAAASAVRPVRPRGRGRPTKKERREWGRIFGR